MRMCSRVLRSSKSGTLVAALQHGGGMKRIDREPARDGAAQSRRDAADLRYTVSGQTVHAPPLPSGLYIVATPIGNLGDITLRALEVLAAADLVACEDTRVTGKLLDHYGIRAEMFPYHDHSGPGVRATLLARLQAGGRVALVSAAGTPLVSD